MKFALQRAFPAGLALAAALGPGHTDSAAQSDPGPVRWAVIVGISEYEDPTIAPLDYAAADAWALANFLTSPEAGAGMVAPENLTLLLDGQATGRNLRSAFITFLRRARAEDVITVYFAGHAVPDVDRPDQVYFLPHDVEADALPETAFPLQHIFHALSQAYSYQTIFLTDVSRARWITDEDRRGLITNPVNRQILVGGAFLDTRYLALTAAEPGLPSLEGRQFGGGHGVFTHYLLEGMKGAADIDRDGAVRLGELVSFTRDRVRQATRGEQVPTASHSDYDPSWIMAGGGR